MVAVPGMGHHIAFDPVGRALLNIDTVKHIADPVILNPVAVGFQKINAIPPLNGLFILGKAVFFGSLPLYADVLHHIIMRLVQPDAEPLSGDG
ncbi:hypothetical protein D3C75_997820 [compost metagenome]